jgi:hypothetical protein
MLAAELAVESEQAREGGVYAFNVIVVCIQRESVRYCSSTIQSPLQRGRDSRGKSNKIIHYAIDDDMQQQRLRQAHSRTILLNPLPLERSSDSTSLT